MVGGNSTDLLDVRGDDDSMPDRTNDEIRPAEQVFVGTPAVTKTITLTVIVRGQNVLIPASAGNFGGGTSMARVMSITPQGVATIQFSDIADRPFTLGEFFRAWGVSFDRVHLGRQPALATAPLKMTVNGVANTQFDQYAIVGRENIVITYG